MVPVQGGIPECEVGKGVEVRSVNGVRVKNAEVFVRAGSMERYMSRSKES